MLLFLPTLVLASESEFSYDKNALTTEFSQLDKIETYVEKNNVSYTELSNSPVFEGNIELTNAIAVKPNLKFEDVDWGSFAWGFCCWPVGIFTVLINDDKDQNSKNSFWAGLGGSVIAYSVAYVVVFAISIGSGFSSF